MENLQAARKGKDKHSNKGGLSSAVVFPPFFSGISVLTENFRRIDRRQPEASPSTVRISFQDEMIREGVSSFNASGNELRPGSTELRVD